MKKIIKNALLFLGLYILCFALNTFVFVTFGYYHWGDIPTQVVLFRMLLFPLVLDIILFIIIKLIRK